MSEVNFEIRAKGSRNSVMMLYYSMPEDTFKEIIGEYEDEESGDTIFKFKGSGELLEDDPDEDISVDSIKKIPDNEDSLENLAQQYADYTLREKSKLFGCMIECFSWSHEIGFKLFERLNKGTVKAHKYEDLDDFDYENFDSEETYYDDEDNENDDEPECKSWKIS